MNVELPDGTVVQDVPDGISRNDLVAKLARNGYDVSKLAAPRQQSPVPAPEVPMSERRNIRGELVEPSMLESVYKGVADFATGASGLMRGGANLIKEGAGDAIWPKSTDSGALKLAGELADPVAWTIAGGAGHLSKLPMLGRVFAPGGYQKVMGQGVVEGAKAFGRNAITGATIGGTTGALSDEGTAAKGAEIGAVANVALPPAMAILAKSLGRAWDVLVGRLGPVQAAKILREASGDDLAKIKAALANAPDDVTTTQATAGVNNDVWNAVGALAERNDRTSFFSRLKDRQQQERIDALRRLAGGANQTEARQVAESSKDALNRITTPMREAELGAANAAGTVGARLQGEATGLADAATGKVADVRRLVRAGEIADDVAQSGRMRLDGGAPPVPGLPRAPGRYSYGAELADLADRIATKAADDSLILGQGARFKQMQVDSLAEHGLKPLDARPILGMLSAKLRDPKIGAEDINAKVLTKVRDAIAQWTNAGGVIDASALYGIRKSAVNDAIEQLMAGADPKAKALRAAGVLREVKPLIDNAIEMAGGKNWKNYLKTFEDGMHVIDQQRMGAKALDLLQRSPGKLESLAAGNEPKMVEKVFDTEFDLRKAMGSKALPIEKAASEIARDRLIEESAKRGEGGLTGILSENVSRFKLPNWINAKVAITNRALDELETRVNKVTMSKIYDAMRNGKTALELMQTLPSKDRSVVLSVLANSRTAQYQTGILSNLGNRQEQQRPE